MDYSPRVVPIFQGGPNAKLLLVGEAPGPRGADRTGFPFWGDDSGLELYGLVESLGLLDAPLRRWKRRTDISGTQPPPGRYAITNACPQMPLAPEGGFCAPPMERLELEAKRISAEIVELRPTAVLACGKAAAFTLARASGSPPQPLAGKLAQIKLLEAMAELGDGSHPWTISGARAFVTTHPARGQWAPSTRSGKLHAVIVAQLRALLTAAG